MYHYCVVGRKKFSRKVEMSKVETFCWNKLSIKSFSFESEHFFYLCFALAVQIYCTDNIQYIPLNIYHWYIMRQKEFSWKVEMCKVECFYWSKLSSKSFFFESEQFVDLRFVCCSGGGGGAALIISSIYHCCVIRQRNFPGKLK